MCHFRDMDIFNKQLVALSRRLDTDDAEERSRIEGTLRELLRRQFEVLNSLTKLYTSVEQRPDAMKAISKQLHGSLGAFIEEVLNLGMLIRKYIQILNANYDHLETEENF